MTLHKHQSSPLTVKVAKLWTSPEGATQKFPLDVKVEYPAAEINAVSNLTGELMLIKLKEEISAIISGAEIKVGFICNRCLKEFIATVKIPGAEREFLPRKPSVMDDLNDVYLIDMKDLTIDLNEMVRQEIILHFPQVPVCLKSCKGLCSVCGKNLNKEKCRCKKTEEEIKPLAALKKLSKNLFK